MTVMTTKSNGKTKSNNRNHIRTLHLSVPQSILNAIRKGAESERRTLHAHTLRLVEEALASRQEQLRQFAGSLVVGDNTISKR